MKEFPSVSISDLVLPGALGLCLLFAVTSVSVSDDRSTKPAGAPGGIPPLALKYCAACHLPPPPESMPSKHWPEVFEYMGKWTREALLPFDETEYGQLLDYYVANSPTEFEPIPDDYADSSLAFQRASVGLPATVERPKITHVNVTDLDGDGRADVLVCDDVTDRVSWLTIDEGKWSEMPLASIAAPAKTSVFDFNGNGHNDIVVASLGDIHPTDERIGSAWLLLNRGDETFDALNLLEGVARVGDIKPGDFNGDGKTDFVVAMFGWRKTGGIAILEQETPAQFRRRELSDLHGAMQVEVVDFDEDGLEDFVALFTQELESIVLFRNEGNGNFATHVLARAPHPAYGSSGFQLVDLDGDGDLDIIYTNGDMMDEISLPKPYHGVRWFENVDGEFHLRELARMTGCYRAVAHDMNGNGHLDIVVSSLNFYWDESELPSVIWLENDGEQNFTAQRVSYAPTNLATMDVGDIDHDGLPDIVAGGMHVPGPLGREARVTAFFQQGPAENEDADTVRGGGDTEEEPAPDSSGE
ncbi:MAG: VCBS repeat-containing protein [Verrucomicrobiales bacterium]